MHATMHEYVSMPVFVNVFNRLTTTRNVCEQLAAMPNVRVVIVDNASTYQPLLDWYGECPHEVVRLESNMGHHAPWLSGTVGKIAVSEYYCVTDCDLDLEGVPLDLMDVLRAPLVSCVAGVKKSGISLRIDDLPEWQSEVVNWEQQFWEKPLGCGQYYDASIDTTLCMYPDDLPHMDAMTIGEIKTVRSAMPYTARHMPWYLNCENLDEENQQYFETANLSNSWKPNGKALASRFGNESTTMPAIVPTEHVVGCVHDGKVEEFKTLLEESGITKWKFGNVDPNHSRRVIDLSGSPEYLIEALRIVNDGHERPQYETPYIPGSWQYAVTSVLARLDNTLPETLASLASSGFDTPIISIDGPDNPVWHTKLKGDFIFRGENIRSYAHWYLTLQELYFRNPYAQYYAIFQDDFVCVPNLKAYLESCKYPEKGYWNLFTFMENDVMVSQVSQKGWMPAARAAQGHQLGRGAVALVFSQEAVIKLLSSRYMQTRIMDAVKGHRSIDGAVVSAMHLEGWTEYVHNPSLVQHTGEVSSMGNKKHPISKCYIDGYDPLAIP